MRDPEHIEELPPPGRAGGQHEERRLGHFSRIRVTGPSFTSSTSIIAWN